MFTFKKLLNNKNNNSTSLEQFTFSIITQIFYVDPLVEKEMFCRTMIAKYKLSIACSNVYCEKFIVLQSFNTYSLNYIFKIYLQIQI
jgi:hypothetical protein